MILETMTFMDSIGFRLLDITELHIIGDNELVEVDLLFVPKDSFLIKQPPF